MAGFREKLFSARSYAPIPFLVVALVFGRPTDMTMLWGALLALAGEGLRFWGVAYAGSLTRVTGSVGAPELIVAGPFAFVRNPLYVGNIFLYVGVAVMSNAFWPWLPIAGVLFFVLEYSLIVSLEEEFLAGHFGESYEEYRRSVGRFIPRFAAYRHPSQQHQAARWSEAIRSERRTFQALAIVALILTVLWMVQPW